MYNAQTTNAVAENAIDRRSRVFLEVVFAELPVPFLFDSPAMMTTVLLLSLWLLLLSRKLRAALDVFVVGNG